MLRQWIGNSDIFIEFKCFSKAGILKVIVIPNCFLNEICILQMYRKEGKINQDLAISTANFELGEYNYLWFKRTIYIYIYMDMWV